MFGATRAGSDLFEDTAASVSFLYLSNNASPLQRNF